MPKTYQIKQTVQFPELTTIPKEQSENALEVPVLILLVRASLLLKKKYYK